MPFERIFENALRIEVPMPNVPYRRDRRERLLAGGLSIPSPDAVRVIGRQTLDAQSPIDLTMYDELSEFREPEEPTSTPPTTSIGIIPVRLSQDWPGVYYGQGGNPETGERCDWRYTVYDIITQLPVSSTVNDDGIFNTSFPLTSTKIRPIQPKAPTRPMHGLVYPADYGLMGVESSNIGWGYYHHTGAFILLYAPEVEATELCD